jgi:hypothetical protein
MKTIEDLYKRIKIYEELWKFAKSYLPIKVERYLQRYMKINEDSL